MIKQWFDNKAPNQGLKCRDLVLNFNERATKPSQHGKFDNLWEDSFKIIQCKEHNAFELEDMEEEALGIPVNIIHLKLFN